MQWNDWYNVPHSCNITAFSHEGSLTKYINNQFGQNRLNLRNIKQFETDEYIIRKVDEYLDDRLIIKASLVFYKNLSRDHILESLRNLGTNPIGLILFQDSQILRKMLSWALENNIWYRKSLLTSPNFHVELTEGFIENEWLKITNDLF